MGTNLADFWSFPAQLNDPPKVLAVEQVPAHNSETSSTIFPLKVLMYISKILTLGSRHKKLNPAEYLLGHYKLPHLMSFIQRMCVKLKSNTFISQAAAEEEGCVDACFMAERLWSRDSIQTPKMTSGLSLRNLHSCPGKKCSSFYKSTEISSFNTEEGRIIDKATNWCLCLIAWKLIKISHFHITKLITFAQSWHWNSKREKIFPTGKHYKMSPALLLLPFKSSDPQQPTELLQQEPIKISLIVHI